MGPFLIHWTRQHTKDYDLACPATSVGDIYQGQADHQSVACLHCSAAAVTHWFYQILAKVGRCQGHDWASNDFQDIKVDFEPEMGEWALRTLLRRED